MLCKLGGDYSKKTQKNKQKCANRFGLNDFVYVCGLIILTNLLEWVEKIENINTMTSGALLTENRTKSLFFSCVFFRNFQSTFDNFRRTETAALLWESWCNDTHKIQIDFILNPAQFNQSFKNVFQMSPKCKTNFSRNLHNFQKAGKKR